MPAKELRADDQLAATQTMSQPKGNNLNRTRVLLIEDDADCRSALTALLVGDGAEIFVAECGRTALAAAADFIFDVVLTDLGLPDIPGDAVVRTLLATATVHPWVIVMTGFGEPQLTRARESGADVVLQKPIDWAVLRSSFPPEQRVVG